MRGIDQRKRQGRTAKAAAVKIDQKSFEAFMAEREEAEAKPRLTTR